MNKKSLTEQEIRSQYIRPALVNAGWQGQDIRMREEYYFTDGRMNIQGETARRGRRQVFTSMTHHLTRANGAGPAASGRYWPPTSTGCWMPSWPRRRSESSHIEKETITWQSHH